MMEIGPILSKSCIKCHGPEKQKGKLRLDSKEAALKGGKDGAIIVPGQADKSELYRRISLPAGNDDIMPNEGDPLTKAQTDLIRDWINQGAVWTDFALGKESETPPAKEAQLPDYKPSAVELKAIAKLDAMGVAVRPIAMNLNWREANLRTQGTNATDSLLALFKEIAGLVELNLASTRITDAGLSSLDGLTNLTELHLEQTKVTDAGLAHLKRLGNLTYLNLFGTAVGDAGLENLKGLTHLKHLYLWQSKVTSAGVSSLQKALPNLEINTGLESTPATPEPAKEGDKK